MSIATHHTDGISRSAHRPPATRPRDLLRLPEFDPPQPDERPEPPTEGRRLSGARCRVAMGFED